MGRQVLQTDIAIIGGGIAGLWLLNQLRELGFSAILFENDALGSYQTIGSQGMIHGGIKYALSGVLNPASEKIAAMPDRWRDCLAGRGKVDLRGCRVLSDRVYLWSGANLQARMSGFLASKLVRGRVAKLQTEDYPAALRDDAFRGEVHQLDDLVLGVPSLVATLAARHQQAIFRINWRDATLQTNAGRASLELPGCSVRPEQLVLSAGSGNEALISQLGSESPAMQRRPLRQVLVKHQYREPFFGHCIGSGSTPRLTVSSHSTRTGEPVWYLGGALADGGANVSEESLLDTARREVAKLLPWIDLGRSEWRTLSLDRAEPLQSTLLRPERAYVGPVRGLDNVVAAWPTKLTLCPDLGDEVEALLEQADIKPKQQPDLTLLEGLGRPGQASCYWDTLFP